MGVVILRGGGRARRRLLRRARFHRSRLATSVRAARELERHHDGRSHEPRTEDRSHAPPVFTARAGARSPRFHAVRAVPGPCTGTPRDTDACDDPSDHVPSTWASVLIRVDDAGRRCSLGRVSAPGRVPRTGRMSRPGWLLVFVVNASCVDELPPPPVCDAAAAFSTPEPLSELAAPDSRVSSRRRRSCRSTAT